MLPAAGRTPVHPSQKMALKMADDSGTAKRKRHSGIQADELQAMRERSMSVQVRLSTF